MALSGDIPNRNDRLITTPQVARAVEAAEVLFDAGDPGAVDIYEPRNSLEANAAVRRLGQSFEELPGTITRVLEAASGSAELLSSDRLQGLAEIVQNADDAGASQVRLLLTPTDLLVTHDGKPVRLRHVLGFATPWLSTKSDDPASVGRFGIGLMTLRALSATLEVHCPPYHVRIGEPTISPVDSSTLPPGFQKEGWTTLRIPVREGSISSEELVAWLDRWDDAALLFLRHVSRVTLLAPAGKPIRELSLRRTDHEEVVVGETTTVETILRHHAEVDDGRSWAVFSTEVESPKGLSRARKATGRTTPIAVALPLSPVHSGMVYAGLPVAATTSPLFVSAQYDPLTSRLDFADNEWNRALVPLVARLWSHAALDLFSRDPKAAWLAMPVTKTPEGEDTRWSVVRQIEEQATNRARYWLSSCLSFRVQGKGPISLSELAVEARPLEHILTETETATLAELPATLPSEVRDGAGRWRTILEDWRTAGAVLPEPVSVELALDLMRDWRRPVDSTIELAAVALEHDLSGRLLELPCVIAHDGQRLVPPSANSPDSVAADATPLARQLGLVTLLHSAHLSGEDAAARVLAWLEESGALIDGSDDRAVVFRLAAAGRSGLELETPLTDEQVQALRDAFELMDPADRLEIGADVGRAISLEAYTYNGKRPSITSARPIDAYLPRGIDRDPDSFAIAAEKTSGLLWISRRYAGVLRSPSGRQGVGAQKFLRLLGAATAPRLRPHPLLERRFSGQPVGLNWRVHGGPDAGQQEMRKRGATYTLQDYDSTDLKAVAVDISREKRKRQRRIRAAALLGALGRAWDRRLSDFAEVESAYDYFQWQRKGQIRAYWLWQVGDIAWLDDESGTPRRPVELRVRTSGNVAIYGDDSPDYLHKDLYQPNRQVVLRAIGVPGDPSRSELVDRLRQIRNGSSAVEAGLSPMDLQSEAAIVYKALAHDLVAPTSRSDLNSDQLRRAFQQGQGLLFTNHGWLPPRSVLTGPGIFRDYRAFAPQVEGAEPLWNALNLRQPSPDDCLRVIQKIARKRSEPDGEDETILLETLRALASHHRNGNSVQPRRLSRLPLWTSKGWVRDRPVYAADDPILVRGLGNQLPLWEPGGELEQFQPLLSDLRVEIIRTADAEVIDPALAAEDLELTEMFQKALRLLEEDLARNDPTLAAAIQVPWEAVGEFDVRVHPSLSLRIHATGKEYVSEIDAKVDVALGSMFISRGSILPRVDGGGRALAELFEANTRRLAQAWRAACDKSEEGIEAHRVELAGQRDERDRARMEKEIESRTSSFREIAAANAGVAGGPATRSREDIRRRRDAGPKAIDLGPPRTLVDPGPLGIVDPRGRIQEGISRAGRQSRRSRELVEPAKNSTARHNRTPLRGYSDKDREDVGMELVHKLLSSDHQEVVDLRSQRNVGADAIDSLKRFYELKVFAGAEPDQVTLTSSEVQRAMSEDKFFLIVVSGIEGIDARPKVRVFVDPLNQLQRAVSESITLSGVRSTESLVYEFAPIDGETASSGDEEE